MRQMLAKEVRMNGGPDWLDYLHYQKAQWSGWLRVKGPEETAADIEPVIAALTGSGLARDIAALDGGTVQAMQQLAAWATTLALHLLASVPEYRARRGPGFQLLTGPEALPLLRELLCMLRLWNLARPPIISLEKEFDLIARLFNLVTRLMKKHEDEALIDECLMLPHKVSS